MSDQFGVTVTTGPNGETLINGQPVPKQTTTDANDPTNKSINPLAPKSTTNPDGSTTVTNPDGSSKTTYGDKSYTVNNADGSKTVTTADGTSYTVPAANKDDPTQVRNNQNVNNPQLPAGGTITPVLGATDNSRGQLHTAGVISDTNIGNTQYDTVGDNAIAARNVATTADQVNPADTALVSAATIGAATPQAMAAQGQAITAQAATQASLSPALQATLDNWNAKLANVGLDPKATVQEQYKELTDFSAGVPKWAQGAVDIANETLSARGQGNSSVAGGVITAAVLQAALPIAQQDAQVFKDFQLNSLTQQQASVFLQAGYIANMDASNLTNNQQTNVLNAQNFMQMSLANLNNEQQTAIVNTQGRIQTMLSDQAAINTAAQFNASSKNQATQFYKNLNATISQFNSAQTNAMTQFNAGQWDSVQTFNAAQRNNVDQTNVKNQVLIDQANATYLRGVTTANTASINSANLVNTQNAVNISNTAMANAMQILRDNASYAFQANQNQQDRVQQMALLSAQNTNWFQQYGQIQGDAAITAIGGTLLKVGANYLNNQINNSGSSYNGDAGNNTASGSTQ